MTALKEVDEGTREVLKEMIGSLFEIARDNRKKQAASKKEAVLRRLAPKHGEEGAE